MKKLAIILCTALGGLLMGGCGMKECNCLSTNIITALDSTHTVTVDTLFYMVDTVFNNTRGDCDMFNMEETLYMNEDSLQRVYHKIICQEN